MTVTAERGGREPVVLDPDAGRRERDRPAPEGLPMTAVPSPSRRAMVGGLAGTFALGACSVASTAPPTGAAPAQPTSGLPGGAAPERYRTRLVLLGTAGGPGWSTSGGRAGISSAVVVEDAVYVIDTGQGAAHQLQASGIGADHRAGVLTGLQGIFLTHLHSDHTTDLNNLLTAGLFNGLPERDEPLPIWGPGNRRELPPVFGSGPEPPTVAPDNPTPGTREMVELLVRAFAFDYNDRARDNRSPVPAQLFAGRNVPVPEQYLARPNDDPHPRMAPFTFFEDDRVRVSATLVQHAPVFPALAFRFDTEDGSIVFSGDTSPSENLIELASDADVLVHEVIDGGAMEARYPQPRTPEQEAVLAHLLGAHTAIEDVGPVAERAGVRTLVLNHLAPANSPVSRWEQAQDGFSGRLVVGADLEQVGVGTAQ